MARHERMVFGRVVLASKQNQIGEVSIGSVNIASGSGSFDFKTAQAVEASAPTLSHKIKIKWNNVEYWLGLDAV